MKQLKGFPKHKKSVTVGQIARITGMTFVKVDPANTPTDPGVYIHATAASQKLLYCGRGVGKYGLRGRLAVYRTYVARARTEQPAGDPLMRYAPIIAGLAAREYDTYIAVCRSKKAAIRKEAMILALHIVITGKPHRLAGWTA